MESFFPFLVEIDMPWCKLEEKMKSLPGLELVERPLVFGCSSNGDGRLRRQSKAYADEKRMVGVLIGDPGEFRHTICGPFEGVMEVGALLVGASRQEFLERYEEAQLELEIFEKQLELGRKKKLRGGKLHRRELRV